MIRKYGFDLASHWDCEAICGKTYGSCKYFIMYRGIPMCARRFVKKDSRLRIGLKDRG